VITDRVAEMIGLAIKGMQMIASIKLSKSSGRIQSRGHCCPIEVEVNTYTDVTSKGGLYLSRI
jgi:hypothetical protein